ncbi:DEAD/DEAH box helicase [Streptomyces sp. CAU 1734]|uniref:DEAD/DEAH box helicase n=1 Tax=Streptomyces sp. CAU 1734 TaxID=3140360 RepID=UPI00326184AB
MPTIPAGARSAGGDPDSWDEELRLLAGTDGFNPAVAHEALRRCREDRLTVRDMRLLLIATGDAPGWAPVRQAVVDRLTGQLERARQVLITHTQVEVWPPPQFQPCEPLPPGGRASSFAAVIGPAGSTVTGPLAGGSTEREAKDRAALFLLARLADSTVPGISAPTASIAEERLLLPGMLSEVFEQRLHRALASGTGPGRELEEEALRRAAAGRLRHRDMFTLILMASGEPWAPLRAAALNRAAAMPPAPARLLHWHAEHHGEDHGLTYEEGTPPDPDGRHHVQARLRAGSDVTGPVRTAFSRKSARHAAACALLAHMTGLPEPSLPDDDKPAPAPRITVPGQNQDPVKHLNKHHQLETITKPEAQLRTLGSRVECTYTCRHRASGAQVRATAAGPDRVAARRAAALKLLRKLTTLDHTPTVPDPRSAPTPGTATPARADTPLPDPRPAQATIADRRPPLDPAGRDAAELLREAFDSGCPVTFVPATAEHPAAWRVQDTGTRALPTTGLPAPLTPAPPTPGTAGGWHTPLPYGLAALQRARSGATPELVFWQRAVHIALQLVRARLLYPALDDHARPFWRVGPMPPPARAALDELAAAAPPAAHPAHTTARETLDAFCDAAADALVRTPAAAALFPSPWTTPSAEPLNPAMADGARDWLDRVEDLVDDRPAPPLTLHVQRPDDEQATAGHLTLALHLTPAGTEPGAGHHVDAGQVWNSGRRPDGENTAALLAGVRRVLRRTARRTPALAGLAAQHHPHRITLDTPAIESLLEHEHDLAQEGVRVVWPDGMRTALHTTAVIGTPARPDTGPGERARFSVTALLDFRWQLALDGVPLTEQEMHDLAEAARPLVRVRGRWVLADPLQRRRARHRLLGHLPGTEALTAALTGTLTADGAPVPCRPTGALADIITILRNGEHQHRELPSPPGLRATLRGYQQRALTWLASTTDLGFGAVLADDMGLGKTLTALAFTLHHQQRTPGPTLVVCPASLVTTWSREAARHTPGLPVHTYHGPQRTLDTITDTTLVITTYSILRRDRALLADRPWALVIADEAQYAKNHTSATARHLRALPSTTRLALTGTPVENNLSELWSLLDWTNPHLFGTLKTYRSRWANAAEKDPNGTEAAELGRIVAPFLLRRRKSDPGIAPELPPKIDSPRHVQLTTEQAGLYEALVRETLQQIQASSGIQRNGLVFKLLTALKKITNHPAHYLAEQPPTQAEAAAFTARSAKTAALTELLDTLRSRGQSALVFTSYVTMGRLLHTHLRHLGHDPLFLHGTTPLAERQRMIDAFQAGRHPVMLLSLKAAGTGLTLTRAEHVIHYDRSWNAAVEDQATDRAHRIGQHRTVTVHRLITEHTVEDRIDTLLTQKRALASAVLTGSERALAQLTDHELAELVTLKERR